jgi:hypothetical protein
MNQETRIRTTTSRNKAPPKNEWNHPQTHKKIHGIHSHGNNPHKNK